MLMATCSSQAASRRSSTAVGKKFHRRKWSSTYGASCGCEAATFAVPHAQLGEDVAAAVVLRPNASTTAREIRQFAATRLADFKVPRQVLIVDEIPKSPTGKVQRLALAENLGLTAPQQPRPKMPADYTASRTPLEEVLAGLWAQVLDVGYVGLDDDFFQLGGDSLLATQLISRIRDTMHVEVSFPSFFETPTVADMARSLEAASRVMPGLQAPPMQPVPRDGAIPLSLAQERLWFLDQLEPGCAAYNIPAALRLEGPLNVVALEQSLREIVRRHEILRTTFPTEDGRSVQVIAPAQPWTLPVVDLQEVPELSGRCKCAHWPVRKGSGLSTWREDRCYAPHSCAWPPRSMCCS